MSDNASRAVADRATDPAASTSTPGLAWLLAGLMAGAGAIHFALAPSHAGGELIDPLGFAVAGWFQLGIAAVIVARKASRNVYATAVIGNLVLIGLWAWSRIWGLPVGTHAFEPEAIGSIDLLVVLLQAAAVIVAVTLLVAPAAIRVAPLAAGLAAMAMMGAATAAVVSPQAADHGHASGAAHSDGHGADMVAEMAAIDAARCDTDFNVAGYYTETAALGIDTYGGGSMAGHDDHGSLLETLAVSDPLGGRGSAHLDRLVSLSSQAVSESAAGAVVAALGA